MADPKLSRHCPVCFAVVGVRKGGKIPAHNGGCPGGGRDAMTHAEVAKRRFRRKSRLSLKLAHIRKRTMSRPS